MEKCRVTQPLGHNAVRDQFSQLGVSLTAKRSLIGTCARIHIHNITQSCCGESHRKAWESRQKIEISVGDENYSHEVRGSQAWSNWQRSIESMGLGFLHSDSAPFVTRFKYKRCYTTVEAVVASSNPFAVHQISADSLQDWLKTRWAKQPVWPNPSSWGQLSCKSDWKESFSKTFIHWYTQNCSSIVPFSFESKATSKLQTTSTKNCPSGRSAGLASAGASTASSIFWSKSFRMASVGRGAKTFGQWFEKNTW